MKRFSIASILFLAVVLGLLSFLLWPSKPVVISDDDLRVSRVPLPDGSNACYYLMEAARVAVLSGDDTNKLKTLLNAGGWDQAAASSILTRNTETLAILQKALACPAAQVPEWTSATNKYPLMEWITLTSLLGLKALVLANEGQGKEALGLAMDMVRLGHRLEDAGGAQIHWYVALIVKSAGLQRMREIAASTRLDASVLLNFSRQLADYPVNGSGLTNVLKRMYMSTAARIDDLRSELATNTNVLRQSDRWLTMSLLLNGERTLQRSADGTRAALKAVSLPLTAWPRDAFSNAPPSAPWKWLLRGLVTGEVFYDAWKFDLSAMFPRKFGMNVAVTATRTLLALKAYQLTHGDLPDSLTQLVPEYLPALPVDDFSGKPLIYSKEKKILYSVGRDLLDSGGMERDAKTNWLDTVFPISF